MLADCDGAPDVVLIATGSEVAITVAARDLLAAKGVKARVVSMPSTTVFDRQDAAWRDSVLPSGVRRVAVEAGSSMSWYKLGQVRRPGRRGGRHRPLWRVGPWRRADEVFRLYRRARGGGGRVGGSRPSPWSWPDLSPRRQDKGS